MPAPRKRRRLLPDGAAAGSLSGVALDDAVGDQAQQLALLFAERLAVERRLGARDRRRGHARGPRRATPVAAIRSQSRSASSSSRPRRSAAGELRVALGRARISGRVTVPSSRSVPRALPVRSAGPVTSSTSSSSWKARPISRPNPASSSVPGRPDGRAPDAAGGLEQAGRLQRAAVAGSAASSIEVS